MLKTTKRCEQWGIGSCLDHKFRMNIFILLNLYFNFRVTQDQTDPQYMFLVNHEGYYLFLIEINDFKIKRQRLEGLEEGWNDLSRMWTDRHQHLTEGLNLQVYFQITGFKY